MAALAQGPGRWDYYALPPAFVHRQRLMTEWLPVRIEGEPSLEMLPRPARVVEDTDQLFPGHQQVRQRLAVGLDVAPDIAVGLMAEGLAGILDQREHPRRQLGF